MNRLKEKIKKKWKIMAGLTVMFMLVFVVGFAVKAHFTTQAADTLEYTVEDSDGTYITNGQTYVMRRYREDFAIKITGSYSANTELEWSIPKNTKVISLEGDTTSDSITVIANEQGSTSLRLNIIDKTTGNRLAALSFPIDVKFSIYEKMDSSNNISMSKIKQSDTRKSIIIDYDSENPPEVLFGTDATDVTQKDKLNLMFGNAVNATWTTTDTDIINIDGNKGIKAVGPGKATVTVSYKGDNLTQESTDTIDIYVRPEIIYRKSSNKENGGEIVKKVYGKTKDCIVNNGEYFDCQVVDSPSHDVNTKLTWVIYKSVSSESVPIKDSNGKSNSEYGDEVDLHYSSSLGMYQIKARAGTYSVEFYVEGTYPGFDNLKKGDNNSDNNQEYLCESVQIGRTVQVRSNYPRQQYDPDDSTKKIESEKEVTINIGGNFNLSEAFNITPDALSKNFGVQMDTEAFEIINVDQTNWVINSKAVGKATFTLTRNGDQDYRTTIPDFDNLSDTVKVTVTVLQTFSLNVSNVKMAIRDTLDLYPVFGQEEASDIANFKWSPSELEANEYIDVITNGKGTGQSAQVIAKKETPDGKPVVVTLSWTKSDGTTLTAKCTIEVRKNVDKFKLVPERTQVEVGEQVIIRTDLEESRKLIWLSSDTKVGAINENVGTTNPSAMFTALKPGTTIITALNPDNNVYATCEVTVTQPVTELAIGVEDQDTKQVTQYDTYTTTLAMRYVFLKAIYGPADTTENEADFKWSIDGTSILGVRPTDIAEIDSSGKVTMKREGDVYITVESATGKAKPGRLHLIISSRPMTDITTDVSTLDMIKGDTYTVKTTYQPENASDTRMNWKSTDEKIATVNSSGVITAVGPGTTSITVSAVLPQSDDNHTLASATIKVTVRDRLVSIAFGSKAEYIAVGGSKTVDLRFTPSENVNKNVTYSSSDTSIFTVSKDGVITGVKEGIAVLSCVAEDLGQNGAITCMVYVTPQEVSATDFSITPGEDTVYIGSTLQLTPVFTPEDTTIRDVTWTSSDEAKATVDADGVVSGIAEGTTVITATYKDTTNDNKVWTSTCIVTVEKAPINATGFEVSPTTQNIICGDNFTITPKFTPEDTTNQSVIYQSLDETIITVDSNGLVTGVGPGDAIVQCTAVDGGFNATVAVHVDNAVDFKLSPSTRELAIGHSFTPKKDIKPANANKTATWKSSNTQIATVNASGKVTAKKKGTCTITCTLTKYRQSATCKVKVGKLHTTVSLNKSNIRIGLNQSYRLKATVKSNAGKLPGVKWKSSNSNILKVSSGGKITAKKVGIARVTVMTKDAVHAKASCKVRVIRRVSSIKLNTNYTVVYVGRSKKLTAIVKPKSASVKKVKWQTSDKNIVQVNASGKIWGIAEGDAYITATTTDGSNKRARCFVKVVEPTPVTSIVIAQQDVTMKRGDSMKLSYSVLPSDNSDDIEFSSDNKRVATVSKKGVVKAVGTGNATITILATSGVSSTVNINVVALNKSVLNIRQYDTETLMVHGTSNAVTWYSSNSRVAIVTNGKVVAKGTGTAYIYAYVNGCKLGCQVNVSSVNNNKR